MSLADKINNAREILIDLSADREHFWDRFDKPDAPGTAKQRQLWYYGRLADAFSSAKHANGLGLWITKFNDTVSRIEASASVTRDAWEPFE